MTECQHDEILRMTLADDSHDWQCKGCGAFFVPYQQRDPERGAETLLYDVTEAAAAMLEADEFSSVDERRLIRHVSAARGYFMHADPPARPAEAALRDLAAAIVVYDDTTKQAVHETGDLDAVLEKWRRVTDLARSCLPIPDDSLAFAPSRAAQPTPPEET